MTCVRTIGHWLARPGLVPVILSLVLLGVGNLEAQRIHGRVVYESTTLSVAYATVEVLTAESRTVAMELTDDGGRFSIEFEEEGMFWVRISLPPEEPILAGPIEFEEDADIEVVLRVDWESIEPILLDSLEVEVEGRSQRLDMVGFYLRETTGGGFFLGPEVIEDQPSRRISDLFRRIPGIRVLGSHVVGGAGDYPLTAYSLRIQIPGQRICWPRIYIDGLVVERGGYRDPMGTFDSLVRSNNVEGIEVYTSPAEIPVQYGGATGAACGVYLIWTKG